MTLVDVVSIRTGKDEDRCVEGITGYLSLFEARYAYITLKSCSGGDRHTMRLECNDTGFVWRDRDGAVDKQLELTRFEIDPENLEVTLLTVYDSVRVKDQLTVVFRRPETGIVTRHLKGTVDRVMIMI